MARLYGQNESDVGLPGDVAARVRKHPCFSEGASHRSARLHLPVAPACNIQCHYCNRRYDCVGEGRPGVTSRLLSPEEAIAQAVEVARRLPDLSVVGFAGPGDPLANPDATLATLNGVRKALPDVMLCVATNGLALPDHVEDLAEAGVGHVTVTLNAIDPSVGERIHPWIAIDGARRRGREAAAILLERQLKGIRLAVDHGMLVKVNTVLIPGVNDSQVAWISRVVRKLGAFVHNVMPLLVAPEYETHYSKIGQRGPTSEELERARAACEGMRVMRHCRGCRADAVGRLGDREPTAAEVATERVG
jgi:nitrogen fixation protein NifB